MITSTYTQSIEDFFKKNLTLIIGVEYVYYLRLSSNTASLNYYIKTASQNVVITYLKNL